MRGQVIPIDGDQVYVVNIPDNPSEGEMQVQDKIILKLYQKLEQANNRSHTEPNPCDEVISGVRGKCACGRPDWDDVYDDILRILKDGVVDVCPSCNNVTEVIPNPMYYHECEHCGWTGSYGECLVEYPIDRIKNLLKY